MTKHILNPGTQNVFPVGNGYAPKISEGGPKAAVMTLDFSVDSEIDIDFTTIQQAGALSFVQSVYVDNRNNPNALLLTFDQTGQPINVPANAQGTFPVISTVSTKCVATTTPGVGVLCTLIALNVPMANTQWGPITINIANVNASMVPVQKNFTNNLIAVTGADQIILAANAARTRMIIQAPFDNAGRVTLNFGAAAVLNQGMTLSPGQQFDTNVGPVDARAIHAIGTVGDNIIAIEA